MFLPLVLAICAVMFFLNLFMYEFEKNQAENVLRGYVSAFTGMYDAADPGIYHQDETGSLYKGTLLLKDNDLFAGRLTEQTHAYFSLYYGDTCAVSSIKTAAGDSITGSRMIDENVLINVLNKGCDYFDDTSEINGASCFRYFTPLFRSDLRTPVGFACAILEKSVLLEPLNKMILRILTVLGLLLLIAFVYSLCAFSGMAKSLTSIRSAVACLEFSDLAYAADEVPCKREDEIGDIARSVENIRENTRRMVESISVVSGRAGNLSRSFANEQQAFSSVRESIVKFSEEASLLAISAAAATGRADRISGNTSISEKLQALAEEANLISHRISDLPDRASDIESVDASKKHLDSVIGPFQI